MRFLISWLRCTTEIANAPPRPKGRGYNVQTDQIMTDFVAASLRTRCRHIRHFIPAIILPLLFATAGSAADKSAPAKNWVFPMFSKEGFRSMTARGSEARVTGEHQFEVVDLNLTLFSGDAAAKVENIVLSPAATFQSDKKIAHGEKSVRFIGDDIEATGTRWVYYQTQKKISLDGAVRVTFQAELKDLLK